MAEQFLSRLEKIEESIESLGQMLTRMITLLGTVTELKSDLRGIKDEIITELKAAPQSTPIESAGPSITSADVQTIVKTELRDTTDLILQALATLKTDISTAAPAPSPITPSEPAVEVEGTPTQQRSSLSADKGMKVADSLETILKSLKMGCKAGNVLEIMTDAKAEIMKIVPSDAIMIKIDRWTGVVGGYSKRHELQARDILKLKKELKEEIPHYRPA